MAHAHLPQAQEGVQSTGRPIARQYGTDTGTVCHDHSGANHAGFVAFLCGQNSSVGNGLNLKFVSTEGWGGMTLNKTAIWDSSP